MELSPDPLRSHTLSKRLPTSHLELQHIRYLHGGEVSVSEAQSNFGKDPTGASGRSSTAFGLSRANLTKSMTSALMPFKCRSRLVMELPCRWSAMALAPSSPMPLLFRLRGR